MKALRVLVVIGGLLLALVLMASAAVLFVPAIQKPLVLSAINGSGPAQVEAEHLHLGFGGVTVRGLSARTARADLTLEEADIDLDALALRGKRIVLGGGSVSGLQVILKEPDPDAEKPARVDVEGERRATIPPLFAALDEFDADLIVGNLEVDGEVLLPDGRRLAFDGSLSDLRPESTGKVTFNLHWQGHPEAPVGELMAAGQLALPRDASGRLTKISGLIDMIARGGDLPEPLDARTELELARAEDGERYALNFLRDSSDPRISLDLAVSYLSEVVEITYELRAAPEDFALIGAFVEPGTPLPASAEGTGQARVDRQGGVDANGSASVHFDRFEAVGANLGAIDGTLEYRFAVRENRLRLERLMVNFVREFGADILAVRLQRRIEVPLDSLPAVEDLGQGELLALDVGHVPLAWIQPFLPDFTLAGEGLSGGIALSVRQRQLFLDTTRTVTAGPLDVDDAQGPLLRAVTFSLEPHGSYSGTRGELGARRIMASFAGEQAYRAAAAGIIEMMGSPDEMTLLAAEAELNLGVLARYVPRLNLGQIDARRVRLDGTVQLPSEASAAATYGVSMQARGLRLPEGPLPAEEITFGANGLYRPEKIEGTATLKASGAPGRSDAQLSYTLLPGETTRVEASATGERFDLDQVLPLAGVFLPAEGPPESKAPPPGPSEEPVGPPWQAIEGLLTADYGEVVAQGRTFSQVRAKIAIDANRVQLEEFRAGAGGGRFNASGELSFSETLSEPYRVEALLGADSVQASELLFPGEATPLFEGIINLDGSLWATARDLTALAEEMRGSLALRSSEGKVHLGSSLPSEAQLVAELAGPLAAVGGRRLSSLVERLQPVQELLANLGYETFQMRLERGDSGEISAPGFEVVHPQLYLKGDLLVNPDFGRATSEWPLMGGIEWGVKGDLARALGENIVSQESIGGDYRRAPSFRLGGTVANPNPDLWDRLKPLLVRELLTSLLTPGGGRTEQASSSESARTRPFSGIFGDRKPAEKPETQAQPNPLNIFLPILQEGLKRARDDQAEGN